MGFWRVFHWQAFVKIYTVQNQTSSLHASSPFTHTETLNLSVSKSEQRFRNVIAVSCHVRMCVYRHVGNRQGNM